MESRPAGDMAGRITLSCLLIRGETSSRSSSNESPSIRRKFLKFTCWLSSISCNNLMWPNSARCWNQYFAHFLFFFGVLLCFKTSARASTDDPSIMRSGREQYWTANIERVGECQTVNTFEINTIDEKVWACMSQLTVTGLRTYSHNVLTLPHYMEWTWCHVPHSSHAETTGSRRRAHICRCREPNGVAPSSARVDRVSSTSTSLRWEGESVSISQY